MKYDGTKQRGGARDYAEGGRRGHRIQRAAEGVEPGAIQRGEGRCHRNQGYCTWGRTIQREGERVIGTNGTAEGVGQGLYRGEGEAL